MKNKQGIEIRVGQVFSDVDIIEEYENEAKFEVVCLHKGNVIAHIIDECDESLYQYGAIDMEGLRLISDPVMGNMSEWDVVTDEQKEKYNKPHRNTHDDPDLQWFDEGKNKWRNDGQYEKWVDDVTYRVPRGFDWTPYEKEETRTTQCEFCGRDSLVGFHSDSLCAQGCVVVNHPSTPQPPRIEPLSTKINCDPMAIARELSKTNGTINELVDAINQMREQ